MPPAWTIRSLLAWITQDFQALGIGTPRLDAELLIAHVLGFDRVRLYMDFDRPLTPNELAAVRSLVVRRRTREPVAYILGSREFYRRTFEVNAAVLIPRPDTETLIERALELLPGDREVHVLDLCTGSGAIAVTLAAERPLLRMHATDISSAALAVAGRNAATHGVAQRIAFFEGDLFLALDRPTKYDLVVANPPYIAATDFAALAPEITLHEPEIALVSGSDGLNVLRRMCAGVDAWLAPGATLLFEVGHDQAATVASWFSTRPALQDVRTHRDLGGVQRVVEAHAPSKPV